MNTSLRGPTRRSFLTASASAVFLEWLSGHSTGRAGAQAAEPLAGRVRVALADFPVLASVNGSVYVNVAAAPPGLYPVVLTRTSAEGFAAVSSECTHNGCVVQPYSAGLGVIQCNCHGSRFTAQGAVVAGPAMRNLTAYDLRLVSPGVLELELPGIGFALASALVNTPAGNRLRLMLPTLSGLRYEVRRQVSLGGPAVTVPFSLTETGVTSQSVLLGDGTTVALYLAADASPGFFSVARS